MEEKQFISSSREETIAFAKAIACGLKPGAVLCLQGDLGSGKTTFVKGLAEGLGLKRPEQVKSPTFVLMHVYNAKIPLYHFDCYRIDSPGELVNLGIEDFAGDPAAICCLEWAEKARELVPPHALWIRFEILDVSKRRITISKISKK